MLAGQPPFVGNTAQQLLARHAIDPVPSLRTVRRTVPASVEQSVMRALAKVPADRFPTAAEFVKALTTSREPVLVPPSTHRSLPHADRSLWRSGALVLALVAGYLRWPRPTVRLDPKLVAVVPFRVGGAAPALGYLREGMIDLVAARLTGQGGARAADPGSVMAAWRQAGGPAAGDLPSGAVLDLARRLGAAQVLVGSVVGTPDRVALSASLLPVQGGKPRAEAKVEGVADSLPIWWTGSSLSSSPKRPKHRAGSRDWSTDRFQRCGCTSKPRRRTAAATTPTRSSATNGPWISTRPSRWRP